MLHSWVRLPEHLESLIDSVASRGSRGPVRPRAYSVKTYSACAVSSIAGASSAGSTCTASAGAFACTAVCGVWRERSLTRKIPTPYEEQETPTAMYQKDSANSKPRYNPVAVNRRPSRNQNWGTLSYIGDGNHMKFLTGCLCFVETRKCTSTPPRGGVSFTKRPSGS